MQDYNSASEQQNDETPEASIQRSLDEEYMDDQIDTSNTNIDIKVDDTKIMMKIPASFHRKKSSNQQQKSTKRFQKEYDEEDDQIDDRDDDHVEGNEEFLDEIYEDDEAPVGQFDSNDDEIVEVVIVVMQDSLDEGYGNNSMLGKRLSARQMAMAVRSKRINEKRDEISDALEFEE